MGVSEATPTPEDSRVAIPWRDLAVALAVAIILFAIYLARTDFHVSPREDTMECVVIAEEINAGNGMTTRIIAPSVLTYLDRIGRAEPPWPNLLRSPLPCLTIAWLSRVLPQPLAVALSSGIFFLLSVPLVFLLGHRLGGRGAGWLAAVTYVVSRSGLWFGVTGLNESGSIFALAGIACCLVSPPTWGSCLAAGAFAGVGYLGRSTFKLWALPILAFILWRSRGDGVPRGALRVAAFAAPLVIAWVWWGATIGGMTGEFGASAQEDIIIRLDTDLYPGRSPSLTFEHWKTGEFIISHPGEVVRKYGRLAEKSWPWLVDIGAMPLLVAFFIVEAVIVFSGGKRVRIQWLVYALLAMQMLLVPLASEGHGGVGPNRYLDPFGPIAAAIGAAFAFELLGRYQVQIRDATPVFAVLVALTAVPVLFNMVVGPYHGAHVARAREFGEFVASRAEPGEIIASTHASLDAWVSGMHAIYLPMTPEDLLRMDREMLAVDWVHIKRRGEANRARTVAWEPIMSGEAELPGFVLVKRFDDGGVLLTRAD